MTSSDTGEIGLLRPMAEPDLEMVLEWRNAPNVRKNMYSQQVISLDEHRKWWTKIARSISDKYLIFETNSGAPTGLVAFNVIEPDHASAFWAFYASPTAPRGAGSQMELLALDFAFGDLSLNKLCCEVLSFNTSVISLHEKFGFRQEGLFKAQKMIAGTYEDVVRLATFAADWARLRPEILERLWQRF